MSKILLSYTTINDLHTSPHSWVNKTMGIEHPTNIYMEKGKKAHEVIQDFVSNKIGIKFTPAMANLWHFSKIEHHFQTSWNNKYNLHGYADGVDFAKKVLMEIKSSEKNIKTASDFEKLMQGKYYCYVSGFRKVYFIACTFDLSRLKTYLFEYDDNDMKQVEDWVNEATAIIEKGDFKSDLVDGKCTLDYCPYGENCYFK